MAIRWMLSENPTRIPFEQVADRVFVNIRYWKATGRPVAHSLPAPQSSLSGTRRVIDPRSRPESQHAHPHTKCRSDQYGVQRRACIRISGSVQLILPNHLRDTGQRQRNSTRLSIRDAAPSCQIGQVSPGARESSHRIASCKDRGERKRTSTCSIPSARAACLQRVCSCRRFAGRDTSACDFRMHASAGPRTCSRAVWVLDVRRGRRRDSGPRAADESRDVLPNACSEPVTSRRRVRTHSTRSAGQPQPSSVSALIPALPCQPVPIVSVRDLLPFPHIQEYQAPCLRSVAQRLWARH